MAEMNMLDDFLFGSMVAYPEIGERFVKILLKTIFGREFRHLSVTAQKVLYGTDTDLHGARIRKPCRAGCASIMERLPQEA